MAELLQKAGLARKHGGYRLKSVPGGFALVLVLWILSLLIIMAGSFALTMRREATVVAIAKDNAAALAMAEAGIAVAQIMTMNPEQNKRWRTDGNIYQVNFGAAKVRLQLLSETGKIDINKADIALLESVFKSAPVEEEAQKKLISAILDWRDPDDLLNLEGAEKKEYRDAGLKYEPRNKPFQTVEELQMVLGMNERVYNWLEPLATVYSRQPKVNLQLATPKVLKLLPNMDADLIDNFIISRRDSAKNDMPAPQFPGSIGGFPGATVSNEAFTIVSEALMPDESRALVTATLVKSANLMNPGSQSNYKAVKWQRNPGNVPSLFTGQMDEFLVKEYVESELGS